MKHFQIISQSGGGFSAGAKVLRLCITAESLKSSRNSECSTLSLYFANTSGAADFSLAIVFVALAQSKCCQINLNSPVMLEKLIKLS